MNIWLRNTIQQCFDVIPKWTIHLPLFGTPTLREPQGTAQKNGTLSIHFDGTHSPSRNTANSKNLLFNFLGVLVLLPGFCPLLSQASDGLLRTDSAYSTTLGRIKRFTVLLPEQFDSTRRYPVLYLLHGWGGAHQNWSQKTKLTKHRGAIPLIIIMPDAENSWYANSLTKPADRYEDYTVQELPRTIATRYPIDTLRQAIAGLSMGGYGAIMLALRHPGRYKFAGSLSGALTMPRDIELRAQRTGSLSQPITDFVLPSLYAAFGGKDATIADSLTKKFRAQYDIFSLLLAAQPVSTPYLYCATGIQDRLPIFAGHLELTALLRQRQIRYEYHETQGGHTWEYWDREIEPLLRRLWDIIR